MLIGDTTKTYRLGYNNINPSKLYKPVLGSAISADDKRRVCQGSGNREATEWLAQDSRRRAAACASSGSTEIDQACKDARAAACPALAKRDAQQELMDAHVTTASDAQLRAMTYALGMFIFCCALPLSLVLSRNC